MNVAFLAAEAEPFIKVGGLGDVAGSLPPALLRLSIDIRLIMPLHAAIRRQGLVLNFVCSLSIQHDGAEENVKVYSCQTDGVLVYFIDSHYFGTELPVYLRDDRADGWRYGLFSLAALSLIRELNWHVDILHANDWHTALAVYGLAHRKLTDPFFAETRSVLSVHNLPYMGSDATPILDAFLLPKLNNLLIPEWSRNAHLAMGLSAADHIVAVSPTYAQEILTSEYGSGLEYFLQSRSSSISGILNGINYEKWDPDNDSNLIHNFNAETLDLRKLNRDLIQHSLGLPEDPDALLIGMVSRMDYQKGVDLVTEAFYQLPLLLDQPASSWQLIILGTGDPKIEREISNLEQNFPNRVRVSLRFDQRLSHQIYASADLLLIPSRYEPCGLTQMIGMRYGCVPLARATGGLLDTIRDFDQCEQSTGFLFEDPDSEAFLDALLRASRVFQKKKIWKMLQQRGMQEDFSWKRSAAQYNQLYNELITNGV